MITEGITQVYCIEDYSVNYKFNFYKGYYYKVIVKKAKYSDVRIYDDYDNALSFYLTSDFNAYFIKNHFLTEKELRKEKLKKLNLV